MRKALLVLILISILFTSCKEQKCAAYNRVEIEKSN